ncbi:MAG: DUF2939 domain-containing protein, partial [Candidatus Omnitrophica bacterium]|nr:DUF2939 domain-containing protein [Candidatus Omnitrophota bacterium]
MKKFKIVLVVIALLLFAVGVFGAPYLAVYNLHRAVEAKDADAMSDYIDFSSTRESIKAQLNAQITKEMAKTQNDDNPFAGLGMAFAMSFINPMIDSFVSPEGIAALMKGEKPEMDE